MRTFVLGIWGCCVSIFLLAPPAGGQEVKATRRIGNPNYTLGEDVSVTLTAQRISVPVTLKDTVPANFDIVDSGGGTVAGKTIEFVAPADPGGDPPRLVRALPCLRQCRDPLPSRPFPLFHPASR